MASAVDIGNLALAHLGEDPAITSLDAPPTGGAHAKKAAIFYPMARDALLEMHDWGFATRRVVLAELDEDTLADGGERPAGYNFGYAFPNECVKIQRIIPVEATDDTASQDFLVEILDSGDKVVWTNVEDACAIYTELITDTTKFTPLFVSALAHMLASHLAGPIIKGREGRSVAAEHLKHAMLVVGQAAASDANARQQADYTSREPAPISARR